MRAAFLVNAVDDVVSAQTTALLIAGAAARGHETFVLGVSDLSWSGADAVTGHTRRVPAGITSLTEAVRCFQAAPAETLELASLDILMFRTNPARCSAPRAARTASAALRSER